MISSEMLKYISSLNSLQAKASEDGVSGLVALLFAEDRILGDI